jgi:hypothetical protein
MLLVLYLVLIGIFHTLLSIILPGTFFYKKLQCILRTDLSEKREVIEYFFLFVVIGLLFNSFEFLTTLALIHYLHFVAYYLASFKYFIDISLSGWILYKYRLSFSQWVRQIIWNSANLTNIGLLGLAFLVGVLAIVNYPHVLDCGQLQWTKLLLDGYSSVLTPGAGAIGYSALIYFPAVIFHQIPLVTLAAGFKVLLVCLFALISILMVNRVNFICPNFAKFAYFILGILTYFGSYGVLQVGKDSIFGIIFSLAYLLSLKESIDDKDYIKSALYFSCATIMGSITVPYLILMTFMYSILMFNKIRVFSFAFYLLLISFMSLLIQFYLMLHISISYFLLFISALILFCYALRDYQPKIEMKISINAFLTIFIILTLLGCYYCMPYKVALIPWIDALGNPIIEYRAPLDGIMTFKQFLFSFGNLNFLIIVCGILGQLIFAWKTNISKNVGIIIFSVFPFSMILLILCLGRLHNSPFSGFNLWDMIRDVPNWYGGFIFVFFALFCINFLISTIFYYKKTLFIFFVSLLIIVSINHNKKYVRQLIKFAYFTKTGGSKDLYFSDLTHYLVSNKFTSDKLYIAKDTKAFPWFYSFQMYANFQFLPLDLDQNNNIASVLNNLPALLITNSSGLMRLASNSLTQNIYIQEVHYFESVKESLYVLMPHHGLKIDHDFSPLEEVLIDLKEGFYPEERVRDTAFHWVQKKAHFAVYIMREGIYQIVLHPISINNLPNTLSIEVNKKASQAKEFSTGEMPISISVFLPKGPNKIILVNSAVETNFPNDRRNISYGIFMPISA